MYCVPEWSTTVVLALVSGTPWPDDYSEQNEEKGVSFEHGSCGVLVVGTVRLSAHQHRLASPARGRQTASCSMAVAFVMTHTALLQIMQVSRRRAVPP